MSKKPNPKTKRNTSTSTRKSTWSRLTEVRRNRRTQRRNDRQEAVVGAVDRMPRHLRPLGVDASAICAAGAATIDPTAGLVVGGAALAGFGINTAMSGLREVERKIASWHLAGASAWSLTASQVGLDTVPLWIAGVVGAIAAQSTWAQARAGAGKSTTARVSKSLAETWNDDEAGVLAKVGAAGARMTGHQPIANVDGAPIGDAYTVDLDGSSTKQSAFCAQVDAVAHYMPGRVRPHSITARPDTEDATRVHLRHIWVSPWKPVEEDPAGETVVTHPVVAVLQELSDAVEAATRYRDDPEAARQPLPPHVAAWLPKMRSYADPAWIGQTEDRGSYHKVNYRKGFGVRHSLTVAESGGGKTSLINSEFASIVPTRDCVIWYMDVSTKSGVDVAPWGGCIDWFVTNPEEGKEMLLAAKRIMDSRSETFGGNGGGGIRTPSQCPTIKIVIDEITSTFEEIDELIELLKPIITQGRSQGVQVEMYGQGGSQQGVAMRGWQELLRLGIHQRGALKVNDHSALRYALKEPDNVPYDMTSAPEGVVAWEAHKSNRADVFRAGYIDMGDPDEGVPGVIPAISSIYAPFRPVIEASSVQAAGSAYVNRKLVRTENPFLTPTEVAISHPPVNPVMSDGDLAENAANITTAHEWITTLLRGELDMNPSALIDLVEQEMPEGDSPEQRQERRQILGERHAAFVADMDAELGELEHAAAQMENAKLVDITEQPAQFSDDDEIMAVAIRMLRQNAKRGFTTAELLEELGGTKDRRTVNDRLKYLCRAGRVVRTGTTKNTRWYDPQHAPEEASQ